MYRYKRAEKIINGNIYSLLEKNSDRLVSKPINGFSIADDNDAIKISYIYECRTITYINIISIRCEAVLQLQPD